MIGGGAWVAVCEGRGNREQSVMDKGDEEQSV